MGGLDLFFILRVLLVRLLTTLLLLLYTLYMVGLLMVVGPLFGLRLTRMLARVGSVGGSLLTALLHNLWMLRMLWMLGMLRMLG